MLVNPFSDERLAAIHAVVTDWPSDLVFDHISTISDELQPIRINTHMYKQLFLDDPTDETWFIVFLKTFRSDPKFYFSEFVMNTMKVLADEY